MVCGMRTPVVVSLVLLAVACQPPDPAGRTAEQYTDALEPLLYENGMLAERVLFAASDVYNDAADAEATRTVWHEEIVPVARHLADQAAVTLTPAEWSPTHGQLVETWNDRADAYLEIEIAIEEGDREGWTAARKKADDAKLREEEWFRSLNTQLAPYGLAVDQFP